jgi:redox-sensing transcriptional repressor
MKTNKNCVIRLSRYKNALYRLKSLGFVKIFSDNLADAVGVTATQVRKDFSQFGISGTRKGGYQIDDLINNLNRLLGKDEIHKVVVAGIGNIGTALLNYKGFEKESIKIIAGFDINTVKQNAAGEIPVFPIAEMENFIRQNQIKIGVIAVPDFAAQQIADTMIQAGVKGILNFAPMRLHGPENVVINNVNLVLELENTIYFANAVIKTGVVGQLTASAQPDGV